MPELTYPYKGQDYTFVNQLDRYLQELLCPICCDIVSEPLQTSCGHLFCNGCYNANAQWTAKCPLCKQQHTRVPDEFIHRKVRNLEVRCVNHQLGCKWVGNLGEEMQHRMTEGSCQFEEMPCPYNCGDIIRRLTQEGHLNECTMRPYRCPYCGKKGIYYAITGEHAETCTKYPVPCPNGCNTQIPRKNTSRYQLEKKLAAIEKQSNDHQQKALALERETEAKTERIHELERNAKDQAERICELEGNTRVKRVNQLTAENSAQQNKLKFVKKFIMLALGITVLCKLNPIYFIPIFCLLAVVCAKH